MIQTLCFWDYAQPSDQCHRFTNPAPCALLSEFPYDVNLTVLSVGFNLSRGNVSCTHVIEIEGQVVVRHQHPPMLIAFDDGGAAFRLTLDPFQVLRPCVLTIKTSFSDGTRGEDLNFPIIDKATAFPGLAIGV